MSNELPPRPPTWKCYLNLCKSSVVSAMLMNALIGMLLAIPTLPPLDTMFYASLGIVLAASSAAAANHLIDLDIDKQLNPRRPLPMGWLTPQQVLVFVLALAVISMLLLTVMVNMTTAVLTFIAGFGYAIIYTKYLKRMSSQNIVIGGVFGAMPPLLGWSAITNEIHPHALLLVLIIFVWTPPHFWPLAIVREEKYQDIYDRFKIPMLPVTHGLAHTRLQVLLYSLLLFIVTLLPYLTGMSGLIYLGSVIPLGLGFIYFAVLMMRNKDKKTAKTTFWYSIIHLNVLFVALLVDHYWMLHL